MIKVKEKMQGQTFTPVVKANLLLKILPASLYREKRLRKKKMDLFIYVL